ncbi:hypothetical protein DUNSADRAFT_15050 [Dunaliella salina]|uniref:Transporter n=1 Tax=Dunaliella salina TaxID=3046 RepID=A0ABQ7G658_DUNSA|nr:hypothetical protein DUNSADRAFT_15050 [Dunaliella salina]|eukprot:KAF5830090.1 hypothetical protein DUNSADRAFT_15050 [Dunaliella salina]
MKKPKSASSWGGFPSRLGFLITSAGSVIGVGNIWRFPFLCFKYGGVFLIPYLMCHLLLGCPLLLLELSLGRHFRKGDIEIMGGIHTRLRGCGLASVLAGFIGLAGYTVILAWSLIFLIASLSFPLPWTQYQHVKDTASHYFYDIIQQRGSPEDLREATAKSMSGMVYGALLATWLCVFISTWQGVRITSWVTRVTMPTPVVLLLAMVCYNASLPGAKDGVKAYIGNFNFSALNEPDIWNAAAGQVFFTIGVATGTHTAYGSYLPRSSNVVVDHLCICAADVGVSLLAGFSVYSSLGNLAHERGTSMQEEGDSAGLGLAFVSYPQVLERLPKHAGVVTAIIDMPRFENHSRTAICTAVGGLGLLLSTMYASSLGTYLLDAIDHYVNVYGLLFATLCKCVAVGWVYGWAESIEIIGKKSTVLWSAGFGLSVVICLGSSLAISRTKTFKEDGVFLSISIPVAALLLVVAFGAALWIWKKDRHSSLRPSLQDTVSAVQGLILSGPNKLRGSINECAKEHGNAQLPWVWDILIKYVLCAVLPALLLSSTYSDAISNSKGYQDYPAWLQVVGLLFLASMLLSSIVFAVMPSWMDWLAGSPSPKSLPKTSSTQMLCPKRLPHINSSEHFEHCCMHRSSDQGSVSSDNESTSDSAPSLDLDAAVINMSATASAAAAAAAAAAPVAHVASASATNTYVEKANSD